MTPEKFEQIMKAAGISDLEEMETSSLSALKLEEDDAAFNWSVGDLDHIIEKQIKAAQISLLACLEPCLNKKGLSIYTSTWESSLEYSWNELLEFGGIDEIEEYDEKINKIIEAINTAGKFWKDKWDERKKG